MAEELSAEELSADEEFSGEFVDEQLVQSIEIKDPFEGEVAESAAKRPKKGYSPEISIADISLPDLFESNVSSSISSSSETVDQNSDEGALTGSSSSYVDDIDIEDPFNFGVQDFYDYGSDDLYSSSNLSVTKSLAILFTWFSSFPGISKEAFGKLLYILHNLLLPINNKLPDTYSKAMNMIQHLLVPAKEFDCCINDCVTFRKCAEGDYTDYTCCPKCHSNRYEPNTKVPKKRFKFIPIGPRLKRMFSDETISHLLQRHQNTFEDEVTSVSDLHQSEAWRSSYSQTGRFEGDARGISLSLCTDGTNPFSKEKVSYSMWPITLSVLNFPLQVRNRPGSLLLAGIIPGKTEPSNLDPYIEILVDEIVSLQGSLCFDAYKKENFKMDVDILMNVLDYPGQNKLFHCVGAGGYAGCSYCTHRGEYSKALQKMVYPGNRCFLASEDILRNDAVNFPSMVANFSEPPRLKTTEYVDNANKKYDAACSTAERTELIQETGCKGTYALRMLPLHDRLMTTPVDPMHLIKNIAAHCVNLIAGLEDSHKVREEEKLRNRFPTSWIKDRQKGLPLAPFCLSKEDICLADQRAKRVMVPYGFDWHPREIFKKNSGMKSHEWKQVCCNGILKFCVRGLLGKRQRSTIFKVFDILRSVCAEEFTSHSVENLEKEVHIVLSLVERDFPVSMQFIVFHLLHHLPMYIRRFGPVHSFWMYPYERFNSWLTRRILNRRYPEASVIETYRISEWANFLELSGKLHENTISFIQSSDPLPDCCPKGRPFTITGDLLEHLRNHYISELPAYKELVEEYNQEIHQLGIGHSSFPMSEWLLKHSVLPSTQEQEMCAGPSTDGTQLKRYSYKDCYGSSIVVSSAEFEQEYSYCRSSYVSSIDSQCVGRILQLFQHSFLSTHTILAYISWFDGPYLDTDSKLHYVLANAQTQSVVSVTSLSKPLVIAYDDEEEDKVWILNL